MRDRRIPSVFSLLCLCLFCIFTGALPAKPIAASDIRYPALDSELDYYEVRFPSGLRYLPGWYGTFQFAPEVEEILLFDDLMEFDAYHQEWFGRTLISMKPGNVPQGEEGGTSIRQLTLEETRTVLHSYPPDVFKPFEPEIIEVIQSSTLWTQPHAGERVEQRWKLESYDDTLEIVEGQDGYYKLVDDYERELDGDITDKLVKIPIKLTEKQQSYLESVRQKEAAAPEIHLNLDKFDPPRYWVNDGGNWNDTGHWANASGNVSAGASIPTNADQVFFDSNSFSAANQTVTVNMASQCLDLNWTQVTNNPTLHHAAGLSFFRNAEFSQNMTVTNTGTYALTARHAACTLKTNGLTLRAVWVESGGLTLLDDTTLSSTFTVWRGNLTTNNHTLTASSVSLGASASYSETINLGSSNITANGLASAYGIFSANTAVITIEGKGSLQANVNFNGTTIRLAGDGTHTITGTFSLDTLSFAPPGFVQAVKVTPGSDITVNRLIKEGIGYALIDSSGNWSITDADGGANTLNNIQISGSRAYPDDSFIADIHTVDNGNNIGWEFLTPAPPVSVKNDVLLLLSNGAGDYGARITNIAGSLENWGLNVDIIENSNAFELIEDGNDWYLDNHAGSVIHLVKNQEMLYRTILFGLTSSEAIYGILEGNERRVKQLLESYPFVAATKRPVSYTGSNNHNVWQMNRNNVGSLPNTITMTNPFSINALETYRGWESTFSGTNNYINRNTTVKMLEVFDSGNPAIALTEYRSGGKALTIAFSDWGYAVHRSIFVSLLLEYTEAPYKIPYYSYEVDDAGGPATGNHEYIDFIEWTIDNLGGYPTLAFMGKYLDDNPPPNIRVWGQNPDKYYFGDVFNPDLPLLIADLKECPEYVIASHSYNHDRDLWMYTATGLPVDGFADDDEDGLLNWEDDDLLGAGVNNNYNPDLDIFSGGALADYNLAQQTLAFSREREIYSSLGLDFYKVLITPKFVHIDGFVNTLAAQYGFTVLSGHIGQYMGYYMTGGYVHGIFVPGRVAPSDSPQNPDIPLEGTSLTGYVNQFRAYTGLQPLVLITTHIPQMRQGETPGYEARDSALDAWLRLNAAGFKLLSTQSATSKHIGWLWTTMDSISAGNSQMELVLDSVMFEDGTGRKELGIVLPHSVQSAKTGELYNIYIDDDYLYYGKQSGISEAVDITFGRYDTKIPRLAYVSTPATDVLKSVFDPSMETIHITLHGYFDTEIKIENLKPGTEYEIVDITANTTSGLFTTDGSGVLAVTLELNGEHEFIISESPGSPSEIKEPVVLTRYPDSNAIDCVFGNVMKAQTFTPASSWTIKEIRFQMRKSGSPSGNVEMGIMAVDSAGKPAGEALASASFPCANVTGSPQWHSFSFSDDITLEGGITYAICLSAPQGDSLNRIWYQVDIAGSYPSGYICQTYSAGVTWTTLLNYDAAFEVIGWPVVLIRYTDSNAIDCVYGNVMKAQTITPVSSLTLTYVKLQMKKSGSPSGNVEMSIMATDSTGKPVGDPLASSFISCAAVTDSTRWHSFFFNDDITLESGRTYAICLSLPHGTISNRVWYQVNTTGSYPSGFICQTYSAGVTWTTLKNYDAAFEVIGW